MFSGISMTAQASSLSLFPSVNPDGIKGFIGLDKGCFLKNPWKEGFLLDFLGPREIVSLMTYLYIICRRNLQKQLPP